MLFNGDLSFSKIMRLFNKVKLAELSVAR